MHNLGVPLMLQITDQSLSDVIPFHHEFERTFIILAWHVLMKVHTTIASAKILSDMIFQFEFDQVLKN